MDGKWTAVSTGEIAGFVGKVLVVLVTFAIVAFALLVAVPLGVMYGLMLGQSGALGVWIVVAVGALLALVVIAVKLARLR